MASVLVIDDSDEFRKAICSMLSSLGYEFREAPDGAQGLASYRSNPANVVILDMFMPVKDGIETLLELLLLDPKARVIAITGGGTYNNSSILKAATCLGACKILHKPARKKEFQAAIEETLVMIR
ncbi:MAG: response regulator [bacterium]